MGNINCNPNSPSKDEKKESSGDNQVVNNKEMNAKIDISDNNQEDLTAFKDTLFKKYYNPSNGTTNVFPKEWCTPEELAAVKFNKSTIISIIDSQFDQEKKYEEIYNKNNLIISYSKTGTVLSSEFFIMKCTKVVNKSDLPQTVTKEYFGDLICDGSKRKSWDKQLKEVIRIEQRNESSLTQTIMNKPMVLMPERDYVEKSIKFEHDKSLYLFSTSANDNVKPTQPERERCYTILSCYKIEENEQSFTIHGFYQAKAKIPVETIKQAFPKQLVGWYNGLIGAAKKK